MSRYAVREVAIDLIDLIDKNARFMSQTTFNQLVENIRKDGQLSSVPFCVEKPDGRFTVVAGNHRVQAAKMAGVTKVYAMIVPEDEITNDKLRAIQLSHNAISGEDDKEVLKQLMDEITDAAYKQYAFVQKQLMEDIGKIDYSVSLPNNDVVPVIFMFTSVQKNNYENVLKKLESFSRTEQESTTLLDISLLKKLNDLTSRVGQKYKIKSQALNICKMMEIVEEWLEENPD